MRLISFGDQEETMAPPNKWFSFCDAPPPRLEESPTPPPPFLVPCHTTSSSSATTSSADGLHRQGSFDESFHRFEWLNVRAASMEDESRNLNCQNPFSTIPKFEDFLGVIGGGNQTTPSLIPCSSSSSAAAADVHYSSIVTVAVEDPSATVTEFGRSLVVASNGDGAITIRKGGGDVASVQRTSVYRGVTKHRWTGRFEAHLWDNTCRREGQTRKGRQEDKAARAYDLAALKYWGLTATTNFPASNYSKEIEEMKHMTRQEFIAALRRRSSGFSRGASIYRGVTRHHQQGRWQARIGRVAGNKDLYLGTFATEEEAAEAYDIAAIKFRGVNAVTNFEVSRYNMEAIANTELPIGSVSKRLKPCLQSGGYRHSSMEPPPTPQSHPQDTETMSFLCNVLQMHPSAATGSPVYIPIEQAHDWCSRGLYWLTAANNQSIGNQPWDATPSD
ncbi:AP2-like ethylene-responsive transcription factor AIL6 [Acorus calamus]|uniref:AP2-like ethylene-responsive transcription factor AIL6 n=1 Tax=Acorus calamus TaxID=4465 RepID=A0AAV9FEF9_ACOCL|nr:AP2-like ethylene-responsive transcription factor AIL6 [Acorus calamus]